MRFNIENDILNKVEVEEGDTEITIPEGVKELDEFFSGESFFFAEDENYKKISRVHIPASLVELNLSDAANCFAELENLKEIVVDKCNPVYESIDGVLFENKNEEKALIVYPRGRACKTYVVPEGVTNIHASAFDSIFNGPFELKFPKSLKSVDMRCSGTYNTIHRVTIYDNLSCDFCDVNWGFYETWFWNINCMENLVITVLSAEDDSVRYKIPMLFGVDKTTKAGEACAKAGLAFNPINRADLSVIDNCYEVFTEKKRKLMTAAFRIGWPHMLSPEAKESYKKYLNRYISEAIETAIESGYTELIEVFINNNLIEKSAFPQILSTVEDPQYKSLKDQLVKYYETL